MRRMGTREDGFTLVELVISLTVFAILALSMLGLFTSLVHSTIVAKRRAVASSLANNQMEYLKSLPYDSLAVAGGSIYSATPLPATVTQTVDHVAYTVKTSISYVDEAYDGCGSYPTQAMKELYCRNYPPPTGAPATDANPQDYKIAHVSVSDSSNFVLAEVDTQISARVAETASATGALFVSVLDNNGNPVSGATISVVNTTVSPTVNVSDSTDSNGVAIFYGLPPDNKDDYTVSASKSGYSSLTSISAPNSNLQPTYPSQKIIVQQSSYVTFTIMPQGKNSLLIETTDINGNPLPNAKIYIKGGYKRYINSTDTSYYYDNMTPTDNRIITDANGFAGLTDLVPGNYQFCGDLGANGCSIDGTTYYLAAALPYGGTTPLNPIIVPVNGTTSTTFDYHDVNYLQKVRLILTTTSSYPRVLTMTPSDVSLSGGALDSFSFSLTGENMPCSSSSNSCNTSVKFSQNGTDYPASCTGKGQGQQLNCMVNLTGISTGPAQLSVTANGYTLTLPTSPQLGGLNVTP